MGEEKIKFTSDVTHRCGYGSVDLTHCVLNKRCCCCERFNFSLFSLGFAALLQKGIESADFRQLSYCNIQLYRQPCPQSPRLFPLRLFHDVHFLFNQSINQRLYKQKRTRPYTFPTKVYLCQIP